MNIQAELKAPKSQFNDYSNYNYRSCEDILNALKPLLSKYKAAVTISDEVVMIGNRYYVKATAKLIDVEEVDSIESIAYAREDESKKGMDLSQLTGSTSSYARKYALNGLFAIDDTKDSDFTNAGDNVEAKQGNKKADSKANKQGNGDLASSKQRQYIFKLSQDKNYSSDSMTNYIKTMYQKESSKELTKKEASELIEMLQGLE